MILRYTGCFCKYTMLIRFLFCIKPRSVRKTTYLSPSSKPNYFRVRVAMTCHATLVKAKPKLTACLKYDSESFCHFSGFFLLLGSEKKGKQLFLITPSAIVMEVDIDEFALAKKLLKAFNSKVALPTSNSFCHTESHLRTTHLSHRVAHAMNTE